MDYAVGQVAKLARTTVRALHHYDEIGLLSPSGRSTAGYRKYGDADLERLRQVLFYRELGFSLEQIGAILGDGNTDAAVHLRRQRELLLERIGYLYRLVESVDRAMEAHRMGVNLTPEEQFEVFDDFTPGDYAEEAEQRWGDTDAWRQSQRKTSAYTKADWQRFKDEAASLGQRLKAAYGSGVASDSDVAMDLAEEARQQITTWFYDCSREMHRGLGDMYVADPRFAKNYEDLSPGLTQWFRDAIHANADHAAE